MPATTPESKKDAGVLYLGIDLGTSRTSVSASNGVRETVSSYVGYPKDVVARKLLQKDVLFGDEALDKRLSLDFYRPLAHGVIKSGVDSEKNVKAAADLIGEIIRRAKPRKDELVYAVIGAPAQAQIHSKKAIHDAARQHVDSVMICSEPFSVAYGLDMLDDTLVIDIGAGTTDLCRMHGTMPEDSDQLTNTFAGDHVDETLAKLIREKFPEAQFSVQMLKQIKEKHSNVADSMLPVIVNLPVKGKPTPFDITNEIRAACRSIVSPMVDAIAEADRHVRPRVPGEAQEPRAARRGRQHDQGARRRARAPDAREARRRQGPARRGADLRRRQRRPEDRPRHAGRVLGEAELASAGPPEAPSAARPRRPATGFPGGGSSAVPTFS
jgi:rod shape-determining protein MreB